MTEVPGMDPPGGDSDESEARRDAYPPPYPAPDVTSDDELAAALAAQTAMYTGPITLPLVNAEPAFRPDPDDVQGDVPPPDVAEEPVHEPALPPLPVPPPPPAPEYIASDEVASDPETGVDGILLPPPSAEPAVPADAVTSHDEAPALPDEELSRTVEQEAAAGSTLDAILLLENELRRRQGLDPVLDADEPPASVGAAFGAAAWAGAPEPATPDVPAAQEDTAVEESLPGAAALAAALADVEAATTAATPGWTPAPDPEREGEAPSAFAPPVPGELPQPEELPPPSDDAPDDQAWLTAPPPAFTPPPLVEPPAVPPVGDLDPSTLTPPPVSELPPPETPEAVDIALLPPPSGALPPPATFQDAPPPVVAAVPLPPPDASAFAADAGDAEVEGIDDLDRAGAPVPVDQAGVASVAPVPLSTATVVAVGEPPAAAHPVDPPAFAVETVANEPTPVERRAGYAARLFWLWFAANSSVVMVAVGAELFTGGMSLRQVLVAIVAGVALSALPLGLGSLAGKWSGQPTMVVSRATFGRMGNIVPAVLAVVGRAMWGGVLLWLLAATSAALLAPDAADPTLPAFVALGVGAVLAALVAVMGYGLLHRVQRLLGILSTLLVVVTIVLTASHVDIPTALRSDDGSWLLVAGGVTTVFSIVGLAWAQSSSDLARYQSPSGSGAANMLWGSFGVIVPTLAILSWGAVLAASDPALAGDLARAPLATLLGLVPEGLALPLLGAASFGLVAGAIVTMYSGGLAIVAIGIRLPRAVATLLAAVLVVALAAGLLLVGADTRDIVRDVMTTLAVPVAAWTGIFASEMMIRLRRFHAPSLLAPGGVYPAVRTVNLVGLLVISAVGLGLVSAELPGLGWEGYLLPVIGVAPDDLLATIDIGVLVALALGLLLPLVAGIPAIRRQEREIAQSGDENAAPSLVD